MCHVIKDMVMHMHKEAELRLYGHLTSDISSLLSAWTLQTRHSSNITKPKQPPSKNWKSRNYILLHYTTPNSRGQIFRATAQISTTWAIGSNSKLLSSMWTSHYGGRRHIFCLWVSPLFAYRRGLEQTMIPGFHSRLCRRVFSYGYKPFWPCTHNVSPHSFYPPPHTDSWLSPPIQYTPSWPV